MFLKRSLKALMERRRLNVEGGVPGGADTRLMTLAGRASSESLKVTVENGRDTYLAVTAVNKSGGEDPVSRKRPNGSPAPHRPRCYINYCAFSRFL